MDKKGKSSKLVSLTRFFLCIWTGALIIFGIINVWSNHQNSSGVINEFLRKILITDITTGAVAFALVCFFLFLLLLKNLKWSSKTSQKTRSLKQASNKEVNNTVDIKTSSLKRFFLSFLFACGLSFLFFMIIFPFLRTADGLSFEEKARIGNENMWRIVGIYGLCTSLSIIYTFVKKKYRLTSLILLLFWFLGTGLVITVNSQANPGAPSANISSSSIVDPANCDEQASLNMAKKCTLVISRDDGSWGSGFSVGGGYIVTNRHVIEGAKKLSTSFVLEKEVPLTLWNYSDTVDLAVLKIEREIPSCNWANSDNIRLAETLYVIGWPYDLGMGGESSITRGIYSRKTPVLEGPEFIQTDASINPGNSGGPLVSRCGVVGINTQKIAWSGDYIPSEGMGFAISSVYAKPIIDDLIKDGSEKKLPIKSVQPKKYTPKTGESSPQSSRIYEQSYINGWISARSWIRGAVSHWNNVNSGQYDQAKLNQLKDLLIRASSVVETIVPKIESQKLISSEEDRLLGEFNSMQRSIINLEGQLDNQNYFNGYYHYECRNSSCIKISERGKNQCSSYYDCVPQYHYECQGTSCVRVEGGGTSTCYSDYSCKHGVCQDGKCVEVAGSGTNECYSDYSCYHSECQDNKCVRVNSPGTSTCYSDYGCQ